MTETRGRTARDEQPSREEEAGELRRRRRGEAVSDDPSLARFGIGPDVLDFEHYEYRSAADDRNRLYNLTQRDDYDFVTFSGTKAANADAEGVAKYRSGNNLDGSPQWTYLLRKPRKFADEDRTKKIARINAREQRALSEENEEAPDKSYTPGKPTQKR